jgi:Holliday junction DNA helicase RuvA
MIAKLRGKLHEKKPNSIILDVNGIFFEISISLNCFTALPDLNSELIISTYTIVREDGISIYGFLNDDEKRLFLLLNSVSKVGPKLAISILSTCEIVKLKSAIKNRDINLIATSPGVGKKTAERIILELRDKIEEFEVAMDENAGGLDDDIISALVNLGYKKVDASSALKRLDERYKTFEERLREALKLLNKL